MYCNLFDTVRTHEYDLVQVEGLFFHMILSGYHPTLSMNQAVDSTAISILSGKQNAFRNLIDQKAIRFSLFSNYGSTLDYLATHLERKEGRTCNPFHFSSLPFLYTDAYSLADRQRIFDAMMDVLYRRATKITRNVTASDSHCEQLNAYVYAARDLDDRLIGKYLSPAKGPSPLLVQRVEGFLSQIQIERPDIPISPVFLELQNQIQRFRKDNGLAPDGRHDSKHWQMDSRSYLYKQIESIASGCEEQICESKAIVDLCYNERVASNISDNEDDLMITDSVYASLDHYARSGAKDNQSHTIAPIDIASPYATRFMTWETLQVIYEMAEAENPRPEQRREVLARCCEKAGLPRFEPGHGLADQEICFSASVLMALDETKDGSSDPGVTSSSKDWSMDISRRRIHRSTRNISSTNTAALKNDYAKEGE